MNGLIEIIHNLEGAIFDKNKEKLTKEINKFKSVLNKFAEGNFTLIESCKRHALEENKSIPTQEVLNLFTSSNGVDDIKEQIYSNYVLTDFKVKLS